MAAKKPLDENKVRECALKALLVASGDPSTPLPLLGTKTRPGFLVGASALNKAAAELLEREEWVEPAGSSDTRSRKPPYRITSRGLGTALEQSPVSSLCEAMLESQNEATASLEALSGELQRVRGQLESSHAKLEKLQSRLKSEREEAVERLASRQRAGAATPEPRTGPKPQENRKAMRDSKASAGEWTAALLEAAREHSRRDHYSFCPLPELFRKVAEPRGLSIGEFHDGVRDLAARKQIRLHPFTGGSHYLKDGGYALILGTEVMYYVEGK